MEDYGMMLENIIKDWYSNMSNNPIQKQQWDTPEYSKRQINNAGKTIISDNITEAETKDALAVINNWRSAHAYPLHIITNNLRRYNKNAIVVQRLKRLDSIISKLKRNPTMELYRMQDIGGCRVIVNSIQQVYDAEQRLAHSAARHIKKGEKNYIAHPKSSGYRCFHAIYKYHSDKVDTYNKNMLIEIQFRTRLQHIWATALETMGLYTRENLKASQGNENILRFFVVMSSIFALIERTPVCDNTSDDFAVLVSEIQQINKEHNIFSKLKSISLTVQQINNKNTKKSKYFLLILDFKEEKPMLKIIPFTVSNLANAMRIYNIIELHYNNTVDIVLVSADDINALKIAYPNYFADINVFLEIFSKINNLDKGCCLEDFSQSVLDIISTEE